MKIAIVQSEILFGDKTQNLQRAERAFQELTKQGGELVCFPEMSFTGFSMNTANTAENDFYTQKQMAQWCKKYHVMAAFGWVKANGAGLAENHYTVLDKSGAVVSDYIKIHPFSYSGEHLFFKGGDRLSFFLCGDMTVSSFICYDLRFPEIFQAAAKQAELILVAANWPCQRELHWKILLQARAIETQSIVVGINCVGQQGNTSYRGDSAAFHADGTQLCSLGDKENIRVLDLPQNVGQIRQDFNVRQDRQEKLYEQFYRA